MLKLVFIFGSNHEFSNLEDNHSRSQCRCHVLWRLSYITPAADADKIFILSLGILGGLLALEEIALMLILSVAK